MKTMTKIAMFALVMAIFSTNAALGDSADSWKLRFPTETETKQRGAPVVTKYMELVVKNWVHKEKTTAARFSLLSKEYLSSHGIDPDLFEQNDYGFEEFRVVGVKRNYVLVKGFNRSNAWARLISFRILVENGSFVIEPSNISRKKDIGEVGNYVTAYWTSSDLIKD